MASPESRRQPSRSALRILMIASEAQPFSKTGGLADVATALPKALGQLGHDVTLITPRYRGIADGPVVGRVSIEMAAHRFTADLIEAPDRARGARAAARLPRALRPRRHLLRRARRLPRQRGALRVSVRRRDRMGRRSKTSRSTSFTRTTGKAASRRSTRVALHLRTQAPGTGLHHPQPGVSGHVRQGVGAATRPAVATTSRSTASSSSID